MLSSSSFLHLLPQMYPAAKPAPRAARAPAATASARVSTEYAAGGGSAARTSGPK